MSSSNVKFVIESQSVKGKSMSLCISCNNATYTYEKLDKINDIEIKIKFPSICKFETFGKDPNDTVLDNDGKIIQDKFIILKDIQVDGFSVDKNYLTRFLDFYTPNHGMIKTNFWSFNGICLINFSPTVFQWLASTKQY